MSIRFPGYLTTGVFRIVLLALLLPGSASLAQEHDLFKIHDNDLYWHNTYRYSGESDSLRREVVQMLKSKFFTFNVVRTEGGYNGEIKHYTIDCKRYGRRYASTPTVYWEGEWSGKFIVEVIDNAYRVTVYALYAERIEKPPSYHRMDRIVGGRFVDLVTRTDRSGFRKNELPNVTLMSTSLKEAFDVSKTVIPQGID